MGQYDELTIMTGCVRIELYLFGRIQYYDIIRYNADRDA